MAHAIDGLGIGGEQHRLGIHQVLPDHKLSGFMSALLPIADIRRMSWRVRFVP